MNLNKVTMLIALTIVGIATVFAQVSENRGVSSFDKISVSTGIHVKYLEGNKFSLKLEAENQQILDAIETSVESGTLKITVKKKQNIRTKKGIIAYATSPSLDAISTSSGSKFSTDKLTSKVGLNIKTSSGSSFSAENISAPKGTTINTSSGSSTKIVNLKTSSLNIDTSSGSSSKLAEADINGNLKASASSGSSLKIEGKAKDVDLSASSGSSVKVTGLKYNAINVIKDKGSSVSK